MFNSKERKEEGEEASNHSIGKKYRTEREYRKGERRNQTMVLTEERMEEVVERFQVCRNLKKSRARKG